MTTQAESTNKHIHMSNCCIIVSLFPLFDVFVPFWKLLWRLKVNNKFPVAKFFPLVSVDLGVAQNRI